MDLSDKRLKLTSKRLTVLHQLGLYTTDDLLMYYPYRYETITSSAFADWKIKDKVWFEGEVVQLPRSWRKGRLVTTTFQVRSQEQILTITIFNRPWAKSLNLNQSLTIQGVYQGNSKVTAISYDTMPLAEHATFTPIYSIKAGIRQKTLQTIIYSVLNQLQDEIIDDIPDEFRQAYRLLTLKVAYRCIHIPSSMIEVQAAVRTLKYAEFLRFFTAIQLMRSTDGIRITKKPKIFSSKKIQQAIQSLSFELTADQKDTLEKILNDMGSTYTMYRLVQGDVGCGKTVVATLALYAAFLSGYQGAMLAPTEILARQHYISVNQVLAPFSVKTEVLYSALTPAKKKEILEDVASGKINILIGTHSMIQDSVTFHKLGLTIADEQQRFGVSQRKALKQKGEQVDFLLMSATPIPRTLAASLFGDMDVSTIETMPAGRITPVTTLVKENSFRTVLDDIKCLLKSGRQLYVICAAVDENEEYHVRNVYDTTESIQKLFPQYKVACLHGRMTADEKQAIMQAFNTNDIQILVSTTVVEVGVNVVNATGMIIYDADRFGLSQLHQLRGRIQRGSEQGYCWLLTASHEERVLQRLDVLVKSNNGFEISYEDLRLRGPGDILGTRQSGVPDFILGNIVEDTAMINQARKDALKVMESADNPDYQILLETVRKRNEKNAEYAD
ncbi:ATP-dependent DNA helicase RecG [Solobacterium moorei]|uniref:Probable DNA 3'-5' helicase RecG n=1 Tax=Solobacterium moorei TaxID=102148 RepID=A0A412PF97_9FIRM|nr:ATP-dependent DNA helicase RecG [Solobacterium moorei]RGT56130.1 ATP-dependent DNA helicase RecG [Solobacterium moorei]